MEISPIDVLVQTKLAAREAQTSQEQLAIDMPAVSTPAGHTAHIPRVRERLRAMYPTATRNDLDRAIKNAVGRELVKIEGSYLTANEGCEEKKEKEDAEPSVPIPYKIQLDPATIVEQTGLQELTNFIMDLIDHAQSPDVVESLWVYTMQKVIADLEDDRNGLEQFVNFDEKLKELYAEYRKAWAAK